MTVTVLDCSHHNAITDWAAIRAAGVVGVIHKFSEGAAYRDPKFAERRFAASGTGLLFGRYHFGTADSPVSDQVTNFLSGWDPSELLALDWEDNPDSQMSLRQAEGFVAVVQERTGIWPLLYTGNTLKDIDPLLPRGALLNCRLWLAQWGAKAEVPKGWERYFLWQYTSKGSVQGITGNVDINTYAGTEAELRASWAPPVVSKPVVATVTITLPAGAVVRIAGDVTIERT